VHAFLIPTLAGYAATLKLGLECMHSVSVSSQQLVSSLPIATVLTNKIPNFFPKLVYALFVAM